ncbi:uncharacterized protein LOC113474718 [Ciona intestinalis]
MDYFLKPSAAHKPPSGGREKHRRRKQAQAGAGKKAIETKKKESNDVKKKFIIIGLAVVALVGGAAGIAVFLMQGTSPVCGEGSTDPITISECLVVNCPFDTTTCTLPCPFGFAVKDENSVCPVSCTCASQGNFEGDVHFTSDDVPDLLDRYSYVNKDDEEFSLFVGSAYKHERVGKWNQVALPSGRIPVGYKLDNTLKNSRKFKDALKEAIKAYKENTCIDITPYDPAKHKKKFVDIKKGDGCYASLGYAEKQRMSIGYGCDYVGIIIHEFLHTMGFAHEQTRPDRDQFVKVNFENIKSNQDYNFQKVAANRVYDLKSEYDIGSVMHYESLAFSKNYKNTIVDVKTGNALPTQKERLSESDIYEINVFLCGGSKGGGGGGGGGGGDGSVATTRQPPTTTRTPSTTTTRQPVTTTRRWPYTTIPATTRATTRPPIRTTRRPWYRTTTLSPWRRTTTTRSRNTGLSEWGQWIGCTATCGDISTKIRARWCQVQTAGCKTIYETVNCYRKTCPVSVQWGPWSAFGSCTKTCGSGLRLRYRYCPKVPQCPGKSFQANPCTLKSCVSSQRYAPVAWTNWMSWGICFKSCGSGYRYRSRHCKKGHYFSYGCPGRHHELGYCNTFSCSSSFANDPPSPMFVFESSSVAHLCSGATSDVAFIFGDFNGDRNVDVMCGSQDGDFEVGLATSNGDINTATWRGRLDGCVVQSGQIAVGDFNGDSMSDRVKKSKAQTTVRLSNNGQFPTGEGYSGSFCTDDSDWLIPLDIDGDNKWDLMCSHSNRDSDLLMNSFTNTS